MSKETLPEYVVDFLDNNILFNKFGLVNIQSLKSQTNCEIEDKKLKKLIQEQFDHEFTGGIEFIEKDSIS